MHQQEKQALIKIRLPLKRREIAQMIGITPEHLSRVPKQIKQEGIIREEAGHLIIPDVCKIQSQNDGSFGYAVQCAATRSASSTMR
jgi:DNA-binding transcriptional regulator YhcF (GntR family)